MPKQWKLKPEAPEEIFRKLDGYSSLTVQLLYNRGITDLDRVKKFMEPQYQDLHSPFLFKDMKKAAGRIWQAIENREKICIYSDYDADAVTANAVLQQTFRYLGVETESYIPSRFTEGYGVNLDALTKIRNQGTKLVITVDCGANSAEAAEFCKNNGMDFIITDHHEVLGPTPGAFALINPKNPGETYPCREITGVGVAFKLAQGILQDPRSKNQEPKFISGWEKWLLDLVAIGTVADCHSLLGENRVLVKFGLKVLPKTRWPGLKILCQTAGLNFNQKLPDTYTLGFILAPRLNAAGRLELATTALNLLLEGDLVAAQQRAMALETLNKSRQDTTLRMLSEAREQALLLEDRKILVLMKEDWHPGVVGLVAGRITEEFNRPAIVLSKNGETAVGSARTVGEFNIVEALKFSSEHLVRFGGHRQAAGLTLKVSEFEKFYRKILEYAEKNLSEEDLNRALELDAELAESDLRLETLELLSHFEPFGVGNSRPKFLISELQVRSLRAVGAEQKHLQLQLQKGGKTISAIGFGLGYFAKTLKISDTIDVAAELIEDGWNGRRDIKLRIIDVKNEQKLKL
ncbi:MAG: single-stranded-DNA-specific exonuclease RecJ [Patescibacteria group bacterium]|nr:single-stranded-DNA-specific exonuclease RecJ [Patescibacteria group bacterium]